MSWQESLRTLFQREKYADCLAILKRERERSSADGFTVDINLVYLYEYLMLETDCSDEEFQRYTDEMNALLKETSGKYEHNAEWLFYFSYIAASYLAYLMGLTERETSRIAYQALEAEPKNLLYRWGIYSYASHKSVINVWRRRLCAKKILKSKDYVYGIKGRLLVGDDLLNILRMDAFGLKKF